MSFLENGLGSTHLHIYYQPIKMLNTMFKPSNESSNVKKLVSHMLNNMDFDKYQKFLQRADRYPEQPHKFVVLEYVESPFDAMVSRSERLPGTRMSIHNIIQNPDFGENMTRLFGNTDRISWYSRRKLDYSKPVEDQLSDTRQVVVFIKKDPEDYSELPNLSPASTPTDATRTVFNPEEYVMPSLIPQPSYSYIGSGLNQTIWSPSVYNHGYLGQRSNF
jgi:hypothetical protein